jgi:hypothetical protein
MKFPVPIIGLIIGAVILLFGRKLFWLFVAAVGFAAGVAIAGADVCACARICWRIAGNFLAEDCHRRRRFSRRRQTGSRNCGIIFRSICALRWHNVCDRWNCWRAAPARLVRLGVDYSLLSCRRAFNSECDGAAAIRINNSICRPRGNRRDRASGVDAGESRSLRRLTNRTVARGGGHYSKSACGMKMSIQQVRMPPHFY